MVVATERAVRRRLRAFVESHRTQRAAARALGVTDVHLCRILAGDRGFSNRILRKLGLRRVTIVSERVA